MCRLRLLHSRCSSDHRVLTSLELCEQQDVWEKRHIHFASLRHVTCLICSDASLGQTHHNRRSKMIISFHAKSCVQKAERGWIPEVSLKIDATVETKIQGAADSPAQGRDPGAGRYKLFMGRGPTCCRGVNAWVKSPLKPSVSPRMRRGRGVERIKESHWYKMEENKVIQVALKAECV